MKRDREIRGVFRELQNLYEERSKEKNGGGSLLKQCEALRNNFRDGKDYEEEMKELQAVMDDSEWTNHIHELGLGTCQRCLCDEISITSPEQAVRLLRLYGGIFKAWGKSARAERSGGFGQREGST